MKIKVTYSKEDILKLVEKDLRANGLKHDFSTAVFKGNATVSIEVEGTPADDPVEVEPVAPPAAPPVVATPKTSPPPTPPRETPTEEEPVGDMGAILAQSHRNAANTKPLYPAGHTLMEGESVEWPGAPEQRNR